MSNSPYKRPQPSPSMDRGGHCVFDHERLEVYRIELQFIAWVTPLLEESRTSAAGKTREVCDQLDRASLSCLLNTAEGNGKRRGQQRAKFFDDARGSATECASCLDAFVAKGVVAPARIEHGKTLLIRIVSMLCRLIDRFDETGGRLSEEEEQYHVDLLPEMESSTRTRTRTRTKKT